MRVMRQRHAHTICPICHVEKHAYERDIIEMFMSILEPWEYVRYQPCHHTSQKQFAFMRGHFCREENITVLERDREISCCFMPKTSHACLTPVLNKHTPCHTCYIFFCFCSCLVTSACLLGVGGNFHTLSLPLRRGHATWRLPTTSRHATPCPPAPCCPHHDDMRHYLFEYVLRWLYRSASAR